LTGFVTVSAVRTLAHLWVHKPVNITNLLQACSAAKRLLNDWMHKRVNIRCLHGLEDESIPFFYNAELLVLL